jgi:xylulokinase
MTGTLLGIDVGSSSIKACLLDGSSGSVLVQATSPAQELEIQAPRPGWAEQHPDLWWEHVRRAIQTIRTTHAKELQALKGIGIAYQMHGLVLVNAEGEPVRPAIIWCDSRAVEIGAEAFEAIGHETCLKRFGNSPGNFTASKLAWVFRNEPTVLREAAYFMLPGDYIALRLTGRVSTTPTGLSEGVLWDFGESRPAQQVLNYYKIPSILLPPLSPCLGPFAGVRTEVAQELGLPAGVPVTYRAGDQPNNALALNVLNPGEIGANAGTSGVVYGVTERLGVDPHSRVNNFLHVNSSPEQLRVGVLMCINGAGSFYRWIRHTLAGGMSYRELNALAAKSPVGAQGVIAIPYGNGAERTLANKTVGASLEALDLNRHGLADIFRAAQEGVVFALCYGLEIMREMGLSPMRVRAGNANMFQSDLFRRTFATTTGVPLELYTTDGSEGAARGAAIGAGILSFSDAFAGLARELVVEPDPQTARATHEAYERWKEVVTKKTGNVPRRVI